MSPDTLLTRIRTEYLEMPGLRLTLEQAQRLCGVERALCEAVLEVLVADKFLFVTSGEAYARLTEGIGPPPRPVKAALGPAQRVATAS